MASANGDWMSRMQKRNNLAIGMIRRPSEAGTQSSISTSQREDSSPTSPRSSHSVGTNSISSIDERHVLELQYKKNADQIKANEARMEQLRADDDRMGADIQSRLSAVMALNKQLNTLRDMLSRIDGVMRAEFGPMMGRGL